MDNIIYENIICVGYGRQRQVLGFSDTTTFDELERLESRRDDNESSRLTYACKCVEISTYIITAITLFELRNNSISEENTRELSRLKDTLDINAILFPDLTVIRVAINEINRILNSVSPN